MTVNIGIIKELRDKTNAPMMDCKKALMEANGDLKIAVELLKKRGQIVALKKAGRTAKEGVVESYIHSNNKIGVLLEVNCETDFVAKNDAFRRFVKDVCMQVAASSPVYVSKEDVPDAIRDREKEIIKEQLKGKPENVMEKIIEGKLDKFYSEVCLMEQPFIKDDAITIKECLATLIGKIGENIVVRRFIRFQVGEDLG